MCKYEEGGGALRIKFVVHSHYHHHYTPQAGASSARRGAQECPWKRLALLGTRTLAPRSHARRSRRAALSAARKGAFPPES